MKEMVEKLKQAGVKAALAKESRVEEPAPTGPFAGKTLVVTGTIPGMTRSEAEERIRELGGTASSSVSKKTFAVVAGENPGSKLDKARELGIRIIDAREFLEIAQRRGSQQNAD